MATTLRRRQFLRTAGGLVLATAGGLVLPGRARAADHGGGCQAPWGPLHNYLWQTAPDFWWQHAVLWRESNFVASAYNSSSGASGIAQFIPSTFAWASERFGIYGSPFDPYVSIDLMNALIQSGEYYHWAETG